MAVKKAPPFLVSEEGVIARKALQELADDLKFNTQGSYSADGVAYPDNVQPFVEKHMRYLAAHPNLDAQHYISNLRLKTRIR
jgi:hypothetical protein